MPIIESVSEKLLDICIDTVVVIVISKPAMEKYSPKRHAIINERNKKQCALLRKVNMPFPISIFLKKN